MMMMMMVMMMMIIIMTIITIKEKTFYLATSLNSNSTFFEKSTLIGSAVVKCWELYPCNVVPPAFHVGSFSGRTRPGLTTSSKPITTKKLKKNRSRTLQTVVSLFINLTILLINSFIYLPHDKRNVKI